MSIFKRFSLPSHLSSEKGSSLLEILVSILLISIIGVVAVSIGSNTLLDAQANQDRARALSYTLEALEEIRSIRDARPADLFDIDDGVYILVTADGGNKLTKAMNNFNPESPSEDYLLEGTRYYRVIELTSPECDGLCKQIHIVTYFKDKSAMRSVETTGYLTDWQ